MSEKSKNEDNELKNKKANAEEATAETAQEQSDAPEKEEMTDEEKLQNELETTKESLEKEKKEYMFLLAEFDNFRKRTLKEKAELIKTELVKKEGDSRLSPVNIPDSNYIIDMDYVVMALGSMPEDIVNNLGLELNKWGYIQIDENNRTSNPKVFASGDIAGEKGTVAWAARSGRNAANHIMEFLEVK